MIQSFEEIKDMLKSVEKKRRIAVVSAHDEHTLDAVVMAAKAGLISPVLLGKNNEICRLLQELDCPESYVIIEDIEDSVSAALHAAELARECKIDGIMKGKIETGTLMKVIVNRETGIRKRDTMSLLGFVESPYYHKIFGITDIGLLTYPSLVQKKEAIENAAEAFRSLGISNPKIAVLSAVEKLNPKMPDTVDAEAIKTMSTTGEITNCQIEGPISYDLAMDKESAAIKEYISPVAGDADILAVPDIVSGNILMKSLSFTGGAKTAGVVLGAKVPLVITSRSSPVEDKYISILLSALIGNGN